MLSGGCTTMTGRSVGRPCGRLGSRTSLGNCDGTSALPSIATVKRTWLEVAKGHNRASADQTNDLCLTTLLAPRAGYRFCDRPQMFDE
jgi:hypothetical protein